MTILLPILLAIIVAAAAGTVWLKRAGEAEWRRHQAMLAAAPIHEAFVQLQIQVRDQLTPVLARVAADVARMATEIKPVMDRFAAAAKDQEVRRV